LVAQRMMVRPGELVVIQRGMKFKVELPDGPVRGCTSHPNCTMVNSMYMLRRCPGNLWFAI
jgi:homogentisate 1,2-dioxygenase